MALCSWYAVPCAVAVPCSCSHACISCVCVRVCVCPIQLCGDVALLVALLLPSKHVATGRVPTKRLSLRLVRTVSRILSRWASRSSAPRADDDEPEFGANGTASLQPPRRLPPIAAANVVSRYIPEEQEGKASPAVIDGQAGRRFVPGARDKTNLRAVFDVESLPAVRRVVPYEAQQQVQPQRPQQLEGKEEPHQQHQVWRPQLTADTARHSRSFRTSSDVGELTCDDNRTSDHSSGQGPRASPESPAAQPARTASLRELHGASFSAGGPSRRDQLVYGQVLMSSMQSSSSRFDNTPDGDQSDNAGSAGGDVTAAKHAPATATLRVASSNVDSAESAV